MPYPTKALHASLHRGLSSSICFSATFWGLSSSLPFNTLTEHVLHRPPAPQFPSVFVSNLLARGSFNLTPLTSMPSLRFSPANISMDPSGSPWEGGYCKVTFTLGFLRSRFMVRTNISPARGGGNPPMASTVASYPRHSVRTDTLSSVSDRPRPTPPPPRLVLTTATLDIESPGIISASLPSSPAALPPSTKPETTVMPNPSSLPPANSCSSNPIPAPSASRGKVATYSSTNISASRGNRYTPSSTSFDLATRRAVHCSGTSSRGRLYEFMST
mmetsp:Transcript_33205/g.98693  ORF Transcript_33205/g.98693 Transcript_33205/m.98693 type:complete len:273 (-) Transcript_33205:111-929(-)